MQTLTENIFLFGAYREGILPMYHFTCALDGSLQSIEEQKAVAFKMLQTDVLGKDVK